MEFGSPAKEVSAGAVVVDGCGFGCPPEIGRPLGLRNVQNVGELNNSASADAHGFLLVG